MQRIDTNKGATKREMTLDEALALPTIPVTDAGRIFYGLARTASYAAAKAGEIPTVKIGGAVRAVVAPIAQRLGLR